MSAKALFIPSLKEELEPLNNNFLDNIPDSELNKPVSFDQKKSIAEKVNSLSKDAHLEIFFLLKSNNIRYTSNHNGVFFNINSVPNKVFNGLERLVNFCYKNEKELAEGYNKRFGMNTRDPSGNESETSSSSEDSDGET